MKHYRNHLSQAGPLSTSQGDAARLSISIVIPAHNEGQALPRCLDSLARQSVMPDEVIVVDNNSTDNTREVAERYDFVRVVSARPQGIVYSRNAGFDAARSDVIARIDADTVAPVNWVETILGFYQDPGHRDSVFTGGCYFYNLRTGRLIGRIYDFVVHHINRVLLGYYTPWGSNCAFPRSAWQRVRDEACLRTDIHEDLDLGLHLRRAGYTTYYDSRIRVGARASRVVTEHRKLWGYIMMWPHTLRLHGARAWPLAWMIGFGVWVGSYSIIVAEYVLRPIKKRVNDALY